MSHRNKLERNIYLFPIQSTLVDGLIHGPVIISFIMNELGGRLGDIFLVEAAATMIILLLSIPTGALADTWGRKKCMLIGAFINLVDMTVFCMGSNFTHFVIANCLWAIGFSFRIGADKALYYNTFVELERLDEYSNMNSNRYIFAFVSMFLGTLLCSVLATQGVRYPFYGAWTAVFIAVICAILLEEPWSQKVKCIKVEHVKTLKKALRDVFFDKRLLWIACFSMLMGMAGKCGFFFYNPYFEHTDVPIWSYGLIFASFNVIAASASFAYKRLNGKPEHRRYMIIVSFISLSLSFFLMSNFSPIWGFCFIYFHQITRGTWDPLKTEMISTTGHKDRLSTINSIIDSKVLLAQIIGLSLLGLLSRITSMQTQMLILGLFVLGFGVVLAGSYRKN